MATHVKLILILLGLAYLISPVDIIPDLLLPYIGWIDDGVVLWALFHLLRYGRLPWLPFPGNGKQPPNNGNPNGNTNAGTQTGNGQGQPRSQKEAPRQKAAPKPPPKVDPYQILGLSRGASWEDIQIAHREGIKKYHPDKVSHLGEDFAALANERFLAIQAAFDQLKSRYDKGRL